MHTLILGGSGTISTWIVRHLLAMNHTVTVVTRGTRALPAGVEQLVADRHDDSERPDAVGASGRPCALCCGRFGAGGSRCCDLYFVIT